MVVKKKEVEFIERTNDESTIKAMFFLANHYPEKYKVEIIRNDEYFFDIGMIGYSTYEWDSKVKDWRRICVCERFTDSGEKFEFPWMKPASLQFINDEKGE